MQHQVFLILLTQVWVRPSAEMQFLYGNHVLKSGLGRITEGTPAYTGVVRVWRSHSNICITCLLAGLCCHAAH